MDLVKEELVRIKEVLRKNPRGLNVTDIAKEIGVNRMTAARYLDMLVLTGHVDLKEWGPSKVYFLSQRMPISAMLSLSSDLIIMLDKSLNIINVNDRFLEMTGMGRDDLLFKKIEIFSIPKIFNPPLMPVIKAAIDGKESVIEAEYRGNGKTNYYKVKVIPVVFDEGDRGVTVIAEDITERRRIEQAIRESEEKFRSVIEQSRDGIMLLDKDGTIIEYSKGIESITGMKPEDNVGKKLWETEFLPYVTGKNVSDYTTEAGLNNMKNYLLEFARTGIPPAGISSYELTISRPNREKLIVQFNYSPIRLEKGNMLCAIARDITELKRKERELAYSEEKFRTLAEASPIGIFVYRKDRLLYANKAVELMSGYTADELKMTPGFSVIHPDYQDEMKKRSRARMNGKPASDRYEVKVITKSGAEKWVDISAGLISYMGEPAGLIMAQDITERKRSEEALRSAEERYRSLVESVSDIIWESNRQFLFTYINPRVLETTGYGPGEVVGKAIFDFMSPEEAGRFSKLVVPLTDARKSFTQLTCEVMARDGRRVYLEFSGMPVFSTNGELLGYRGIARDVTESKRRTMQ